MMIIGAILADINVKGVMNKLTIYYSAIRLIAIPLIILVILKLLNCESMLIHNKIVRVHV